jgi:preprotein translocase subunit YajC
MTTAQKTKLAWGIGILIVLVSAFLIVYFKVIKPKADKKREEERLKQTSIVTSAQASGTEQKTQTPTIDITATTDAAGIGGRRIAA